MFEHSHAFSGFSVNDLAAAKEFYGATLGLKVETQPMGLTLHLEGGSQVFIYEKPGHQPASFTILNFPVEDIEAAVAELQSRGITLERYDGMQQDKLGIARGRAAGRGPDIAWFKDPSGNILAVLQQ